jgi:hypothetical protein
MYDVFLSHPHTHADWVERLASRLKDECGFEVWLDKWELIPGQNFVPEMSKGLEQASTCAVCVGKDTPRGWAQQEVQKALNRQATRESFRVIPVLMPDASEQSVADFLELRTWVDFRGDHDEAFHRLVCGIKGVAPGRWPARDQEALLDPLERKLRKIASLREKNLLDPSVVVEVQRELLLEALARA